MVFSRSQIIYLFVLVQAGLVYSVENKKVGPIRDFYRSPRAMGMGNAYTASVRNCEALYYNPAALGRLRRRVHADILNPNIGLNRRIYSLASKGTGILSDESKMVEHLKDQIGKPQFASFAYTPSVCFRGFGFGLYEIAEFDSLVSDRANPEMDIYLRNDYGFILGGAYKMFSGRFKLGVSLKYIVRTEVDKTIYAYEFADLNYNLEEVQAGHAIAIDTAFLWTMPVAMLPRFSVVIENTGDTYFTKTSSSTIGDTVIGAPNPMKQRVHFGLGLSPKITALSKLNINFEIRDAFRETEDIYRLIHVGSELVLPHLLKFRFGFHQGYLAYGMSVDFKYSQLDFASYGQEVGAYAGQKEDTRYMFRYTLGF